MKNFIQLVLCFTIIITSLSCKKESTKPSGTIMLVNNSSNPYDVFVNGKLEINDMPGNSASSLTSKPVGSYSVRVIQASGYLLFATDLTYDGSVTDQGTLVVSFPD